MVGLDERLDGVELDDVHGLGRGNHATEALLLVVDELVAAVGLQLLGLGLAHPRTNRLDRVGKGRVVCRNLDLGEHGGDALVDIAVEHFLAQRILQVIANVALAHGAANGQGAGNVLLRIRARELSHRVGDHAHLGTVAMHDDDLVALLDQVDDSLGSRLDGLHLLGKVGAEGVSAQGDNDTLSHFSAQL